MISPIAFRNTPNISTQKQTYTVPKVSMAAVSAGAIALGGYGISEYKKVKEEVETAIKKEPIKTKKVEAENIERFTNDLILNSTYVNNLILNTKSLQTSDDLKRMGLELKEILTDSELKEFTKKCDEISQMPDIIKKDANDKLKELADSYIRESQYAKDHPHSGPYTIEELDNLDLTIKEVIGDEKYFKYKQEYDAQIKRKNDITIFCSNKIKQHTDETIANSEYAKNFYVLDNIPKTLDDLKRQGLELKDILTQEESAQYKEVCNDEIKRLKDIEERAINALKEELKKEKTKMYIIAGAGFGMALVSLISLLSMFKNKRVENANNSN